MRRGAPWGESRLSLARTWTIRTLVFAFVWWAVAEGRSVGWYFVIAGVLGASTVSLVLLPPGRWTVTGIARFLPFFLVQSARGGVDVALRALRPGRHVHPGFIEHRFRTRDPDVRLLVANIVSLMPGTLSARLEGDRLVVHVLDATSDAARLPAILEWRVAGMTSGGITERGTRPASEAPPCGAPPT